MPRISNDKVKFTSDEFRTLVKAYRILSQIEDQSNVEQDRRMIRYLSEYLSSINDFGITDL